MSKRFDFVKFDDKTAKKQADFKAVLTFVGGELESMRPSTSRDLALVKLEEAYMWIGKALRDEQLNRR